MNPFDVDLHHLIEDRGVETLAAHARDEGRREVVELAEEPRRIDRLRRRMADVELGDVTDHAFDADLLCRPIGVDVTGLYVMTSQPLRARRASL